MGVFPKLKDLFKKLDISAHRCKKRRLFLLDATPLFTQTKILNHDNASCVKSVQSLVIGNKKMFKNVFESTANGI